LIIRRLIREESGYSLVEVMVSIFILAIAIIPMVSMFDTGLKAALQGSKYDKARTLANLELEDAKSLSYAQLKNNFPEISPTTTTYNSSGYYQSPYKTVSGGMSAAFAGFEYRVEKQFLAQPPVAPTSSSQSFGASASDQGLIKITITVRWDGSKTYTSSGVVQGRV
jgi:prepilin-type N-terminal cleavage/methylation domain-containing protein